MMTADGQTLAVMLKGREYSIRRDRMVSLLADSKFKTIYVGNPKSGCTTIKNAVFVCDRGFQYMEPERIHDSYFAFWQLNINNYTAETVGMFDHPESFIFSIVRHPFDRFVSGFVDKFLPDSQANYFAARDFLNVYLGIDLAGDPVRAAIAFLDWYEKDDVADARHKIDPHFWRQSENLALEANLPIDFVGKIEDPDPILDMFERVMGTRPTNELKTRRRMTRHPAKANLLTSTDLRATVERVYAADYEAFHYS